MKLLGLIVKSYAGMINKEVFSFNDEYKISFDFDTEFLKIEKNDKYIPELYGKTIYNITPVVGKNGSGKTTLLNILGRRMFERISYSIDDYGKNIDQYFLLFYLYDNVYYLEAIYLCPRNIKRFSSKSRVFNMYFEDEKISYKEIKINDYFNDSICYINSSYSNSLNDKSLVNKGGEMEQFIPRVINGIPSLSQYYDTYIDLNNEGFLYSTLIIQFKKGEWFQGKEGTFQITPIKDEELKHILKYHKYIPENIDDFYIYFFSCIIEACCGIYKSIVNEDDEFDDLVSKLRKKWNNERICTYKQFENLFYEFQKIIPANQELFKKYVNNISTFFLAFYNIRGQVLTGYKYFKIIFPKEKNGSFLAFLKEYDKLKEFVANMKQTWDVERNDLDRVQEDHIYDELLSRYREELGTWVYEAMPFDINNFEMATGEQNLLKLVSNVTCQLKKFCLQQPLGAYRLNKNFIVLIDEIECGMHIEWSRRLIGFLKKYFDNIKIQILGNEDILYKTNNTIQLVFSTHSPFMLSDIVNQNIILLEKQGKQIKTVQKVSQTFAQNIQEIMSDSFFVRDYWGEYAKELLQEIIDVLQPEYNEKISEKTQKKIIYMIRQIGEPLLRDKLMEMYRKKYYSADIEKREMVRRMKALYEEFDSKAIHEIEQMFRET
ncbi:AAA family ATPase [Anaerospora hongkongensis]|uniref:AAA family ATPase n=1 Tax=Anaerospora hongkongensis TaxID=244830 RepID=UPI00289F84FB|nr:AAA family ATPase [Anaerospora hongkongensis]